MNRTEYKILKIENGAMVEISFGKLEAEIKREALNSLQHDISVLRDRVDEILHENFETERGEVRRGALPEECRVWIAKKSTFTREELYTHLKNIFHNSLEAGRINNGMNQLLKDFVKKEKLMVKKDGSFFNKELDGKESEQEDDPGNDTLDDASQPSGDD